MPSIALQRLQTAARQQSLVELKHVLATLSSTEKAECWTVPDILSQVLSHMRLESQAMTWIPALQFIELLVLAGAPVSPLANRPGQALSGLQIAVSPSWLPHDATIYELKPGEVAIAKRVLTLLSSRSGAQVPPEGLTFAQWQELDPWACLLKCSPCHGLACDLVEEGVFPAWVDRPKDARVSQWPACPLVELVTELTFTDQAPVWTAVLLRRRPALPAQIDGAPALHYFCGLDDRPGAPALRAALALGLDPRAVNDQKQSVLELGCDMPAGSLDDWEALVSHDITLVDEPSSDGRTVYALLMEALGRGSEWVVEQMPAVQALQARLRAYRREQLLEEQLPAASPRMGTGGRF